MFFLSNLQMNWIHESFLWKPNHFCCCKFTAQYEIQSSSSLSNNVDLLDDIFIWNLVSGRHNAEVDIGATSSGIMARFNHSNDHHPHLQLLVVFCQPLCQPLLTAVSYSPTPSSSSLSLSSSFSPLSLSRIANAMIIKKGAKPSRPLPCWLGGADWGEDKGFHNFWTFLGIGGCLPSSADKRSKHPPCIKDDISSVPTV